MTTKIDDTGAKYTLLTNLHFVQFQKPEIALRVYVSGLLISRADKKEEKGPLDPGNTLRGFGTEASNDRLSLWLPDEALPFTLTQNTVDERFQMLSDRTDPPTLKPIFSGGSLNFANGISFFLQVEDNEQPIDVFHYDGNITDVWKVLFDRAIKYWKAPFMPHSVYHPPNAPDMVAMFRRQQD